MQQLFMGGEVRGNNSGMIFISLFLFPFYFFLVLYSAARLLYGLFILLKYSVLDRKKNNLSLSGDNDVGDCC